jgi:hypothetical protein
MAVDELVVVVVDVRELVGLTDVVVVVVGDAEVEVGELVLLVAAFVGLAAPDCSNQSGSGNGHYMNRLAHRLSRDRVSSALRFVRSADVQVASTRK